MPTKVAELRQDQRGDRKACPLCNPRPDRITESQLWAWAMSQPPPVVPHRGRD